jgi:hypothetical protein
MKKLLLVAIVAGGLVCAGATRSNAQVYFSIGFGPGYYGYSPYGYYLPVPVRETLLSIILPSVLLVRRASLLSRSLSLL